MPQLYCKLIGEVQGISLRSMAKLFCTERSVGGTVKNLPDGGLECIAEGDTPALQELLDWFRSNPGIRELDNCQYEWRDQTGFEDFKIIY